MSVSESAHIRLKLKPALGSMYHLFHTALCVHWAAFRLSSTRSLFMSYWPRRSSICCRVASRWAHRCLTAPSMCKGHPTGIRESSRSPSPFCSMTVPNIGTPHYKGSLPFQCRPQLRNRSLSKSVTEGTCLCQQYSCQRALVPRAAETWQPLALGAGSFLVWKVSPKTCSAFFFLTVRFNHTKIGFNHKKYGGNYQTWRSILDLW